MSDTPSMEMIEADKLVTERIAKLCAELGSAIQEATNRGMSVNFVRSGYGAYPELSRPIRCSVQRYLKYAP